jgi:hypothetical protein
MTKFAQTLLIVYLLSISLFCLALILSKRHIYFRGYRSTSFLFIVMSFSGFLFMLFYQRRHKTTPLLAAFYFIIILSFVLSLLLAFEISGDYRRQLFYSDSKYRLEDTRRGINEPCSLPRLFIKKGIFEKRYELEELPVGCMSKQDIKTIAIKKTNPDSLQIIIYHVSNWQIQNPLIRNVFINQ